MNKAQGEKNPLNLTKGKQILTKQDSGKVR
jgi:hypothetical protein